MREGVSREARLVMQLKRRCLVWSWAALCLSGCQTYCARHAVEQRVKNSGSARLDASQTRREIASFDVAAETSGIQRVSPLRLPISSRGHVAETCAKVAQRVGGLCHAGSAAIAAG